MKDRQHVKGSTMQVWIAQEVVQYEGARIVGLHLNEEGAKALCAEHQDSKTDNDYGAGCTIERWRVNADGDEVRIEGDLGDDSPSDLSYVVHPVGLAGAIDFAREAANLGRRATNDPGAFVKRGPDYDGEPYGERLDQWQARALEAALEQAIA